MFTKIHYLTTTPNIAEIWQQKDSSCHWELYQKEVINDIKHLLVIEPLIIEKAKVRASIWPLWKSYLQKNSSNSRLIVVGTLGYMHTNYIDLLQLPTYLADFIAQAKTVQEDWQLPINGLDMVDKLMQFFRGHGNESILEKLSGIHRKIKNLDAAIQGKINRTYEEILTSTLTFGKKEWEELTKRWNNYLPFWSCLPFYPEITIIDQNFSEIKSFFMHKNPTESLFLEKKLLEKINQIKTLLTQIEQYVQKSQSPNFNH